MRYLSSTVPATNVFTVGGLAYFPNEISYRIVTDVIWGDSLHKAPQWQLDDDYTQVYAIVYDGIVPNGHFTPSEERMLIEFRQWLQRLDTGEYTAELSVHILANLNSGRFLAFVAEGREPQGEVTVHDEEGDLIDPIEVEWIAINCFFAKADSNKDQN